MSSPIPSTSGRDPHGAAQSPAVPPPSVLALSGLLKVQRRWRLASRGGSQVGSASSNANLPERTDVRESEPAGAVHTGRATAVGRRQSWRDPDLSTTAPRLAGHSRLSVHLEDSEWSRLALGVTAEVLASLGIPAAAEVLWLGPDDVIVHLPTSEPPHWPFGPGRTPQSWTLPRDSRVIASLPVTPAITSGARTAALVTVFEAHGRRTLVNLVGAGSTILEGPSTHVGVKI